MDAQRRRGSSIYNSISGFGPSGADNAPRRGSNAFHATGALADAGAPVSDADEDLLAEAERQAGEDDCKDEDAAEDEDSEPESNEDVSRKKDAVHPHYGITVRQLELSQKVFKLFDVNGSGAITLDEFRGALGALQIKADEAEARAARRARARRGAFGPLLIRARSPGYPHGPPPLPTRSLVRARIAGRAHVPTHRHVEGRQAGL